MKVRNKIVMLNVRKNNLLFKDITGITGLYYNKLYLSKMIYNNKGC